MTSDISIDVTKTPFSRYGAYVSVTWQQERNHFTIHNVQKRFGEDEAFILKFEKNKQLVVDFIVSATPYVLNVHSSVGKARLYVYDDRSVVIESKGMDVCLQQISNYGYGIQIGERRYKIISRPQRTYATIDVLQGEGWLDGPYKPGPDGKERNHREILKVFCEMGQVLLRLEISQVETKLFPSFVDVDTDITTIKREWESFLAYMPPVPEERKEYAQVTWYNLWSSFVRAEDVHKYDAMLMSKKFMCSVWSYDHCFNALALAQANLKEKAIEQFLLPFELQAESGVLPDVWNPNTEIVWGITKPPIHGWCFGKLMDKFDFDRSLLKKVYAHLEKWTRWWLEYRDSDSDGIPEYPQGWDSGSDNSTLFDRGFFLESPDLSSYLILQMQTLSRIAQRLGDKQSAIRWEKDAEIFLQKLYEHSWNGKRFIARLSRTHEYEENPTSLLAVMPLVLGSYLDENKFSRLVAILERDFLTENGPASEAPTSPLYEPDGYWRGPIWAPTTYLLVDGLKRGGRQNLACEVAKRFCNMVQNKAKGNYECFDALTGEGLRVPGHTWTASVYLLLVWEYLM